MKKPRLRRADVLHLHNPDTHFAQEIAGHGGAL